MAWTQYTDINNTNHTLTYNTKETKGPQAKLRKETQVVPLVSMTPQNIYNGRQKNHTNMSQRYSTIEITRVTVYPLM